MPGLTHSPILRVSRPQDGFTSATLTCKFRAVIIDFACVPRRIGKDAGRSLCTCLCEGVETIASRPGTSIQRCGVFRRIAIISCILSRLRILATPSTKLPVATSTPFVAM